MVRKNQVDYLDYDDGYLERMQDKHNLKKQKNMRVKKNLRVLP